MGVGSSTNMSSSTDVREYIQSEIDSNKVVVWSKSYCPYCTETKSLFSKIGVATTVHELDLLLDPPHDGTAIQQELYQMTGQRTVPSVFVKGQFVGGNDATHKAHASGELTRLLTGLIE